MRLFETPPFERKRSIIGIYAGSEYGALGAITNDLGVRASFYGYAPKLVDVSDDGGLRLLDEWLQKDDVAFAYGYAGVGSQLRRNDTNLWTSCKIPFVSFWFDHPAYNYRQHIVPSPYVLHVYHIRDHIEARRKYLPHKGDSILLPPAGGGALEATEGVPWLERKTTILFAKSGSNPKLILEKWLTYPKKLSDLLHELSEVALKNPSLDLADATADLFLREHHPVDDLDNFFGVMQEVDHYVRVWRADRLARALLPFDAHIYGDGWDYLKNKQHRAQLLPGFPSSQFFSMVNQHRIVANSSPLWRDAIHERAQMAIGCGNIALTDRTEKSDNAFGGLRNYIAFDWTDNLEDRISEALAEGKQSSTGYFDKSDAALRKLPAFSDEGFLSPLENEIARLTRGED